MSAETPEETEATSSSANASTIINPLGKPDQFFEPSTKKCESFNPQVLSEPSKLSHLTETEPEPQNFNSSEHSLTSKSRTFDFAQLDGVEDYSGVPQRLFPCFIVKEAVDNGGVDKPTTTRVDVKLWKKNGTQFVLVRDNGQPEFSRRNAEALTNLDAAPSSKRGIHAVRAGVKGNGLQTMLGISHVLFDADARPTHTFEIWNSTTKFKFNVKSDGDKAYAEFDEAPRNDEDELTYVEPKGTVVLIKLPEGNYSSPYSVFTTIRKLNPDITFTYTEDGFQQSFPARTTERRKAQVNYGSASWYSQRDMWKLNQEMTENTTVEEVVDNFEGFSNRSYRKQVMERAVIPLKTKIKSLDSPTLNKLLDAMKAESRPKKSTSLPEVGLLLKEHSCDYYQSFHADYDLALHYYRKEDEKLIPFKIEVASYPGEEQLLEAVNFTANLHRPFSRYNFGEKKENLNDIIKGKHRTVIVHVVCPNVEWLGAAKDKLDSTPFKELLIRAVKDAVRCKEFTGVCKDELVAWSREVMDAYPGLTFTVRQVFYRLVSLKGYTNTRNRYKDLCNALTVGRDNGGIDPERIVDFSRPEHMNNPCYQTPTEYLEAKINELTSQFDLDRWKSQPAVVEVWIEKEALSRMLLPTCQRYRVNLIVGKGYSSYTQIYNAVKHRFPRNGRKTIILYLGDHDPAGLHIVEKLRERTQRQAFLNGINLDLDVRPIALTYEQIQKYALPPSTLKKKPQANHYEYRRQYGDKVWELDALDPEILIHTLERELNQVIYNRAAWDEKEKGVADFKAQLLARKDSLRKAFET